MTASVEDVTSLYARDLMNRHGLTEWRFEWNDSDEAAGRCYPDLQLITVSRAILLDTAARNIRETLLHEIAHALTTTDHTARWWNRFRKIGGEGYWLFNNGGAKSSRPEGVI